MEFIEVDIFESHRIAWKNKENFPYLTFFEDPEIDPDSIEDNEFYVYKHIVVKDNNELVAIFSYAHVHYIPTKQDLLWAKEGGYEDKEEQYIYLATVEVSRSHLRKGYLRKVVEYVISKQTSEETHFNVVCESEEVWKAFHKFVKDFPETVFKIDRESEWEWGNGGPLGSNLELLN